MNNELAPTFATNYRLCKDVSDTYKACYNAGARNNGLEFDISWQCQELKFSLFKISLLPRIQRHSIVRDKVEFHSVADDVNMNALIAIIKQFDYCSLCNTHFIMTMFEYNFDYGQEVWPQYKNLFNNDQLALSLFNIISYNNIQKNIFTIIIKNNKTCYFKYRIFILLLDFYKSEIRKRIM